MIENPGSAVLHPAATGLEKAMADTDAVRVMAIYAEAIIDVWDPYKIGFANLPYLAWAMGVNLWDDAWRETTKRTWTARQWEFKSLRGTADGMRMAIDYVGRDVSPFGYQALNFTTPPQQVFSGPSLTKEEREAWLATLPQVRVWRTYERTTAGFGKAFYAGRGGPARLRSHRFCLGAAGAQGKGSAIIPSTALERLHRRARYVVRGVETDTTVTELGQFWRLHLRSQEDSKVFCNRPASRRFYIPSDAWTRLITVAPRERLAWRSPVTPSVEPVTAEPERVVVNGMRGHRVFCDVPMRQKAFYLLSDAWARIYERFAISDGSTEVQRRRPVQFMGIGQYGFPKYTAWVRVSLRSIRKRGVFSGNPIHHRFYLPHDPTPVLRARRAVMASKKLVDRVMLELGPVPRFVAGRPFIAGADSFYVGRSF
jgi:phage tail P2-like protein